MDEEIRETPRDNSWSKKAFDTFAVPSSSKPAATPSPSHVPPPPLEVKIRTLASDLELLAQTGGTSGQIQTTFVSLASPTAAAIPSVLKKILPIVLFAAVLATFFLVGYFLLYPLIFGTPKSKLSDNRVPQTMSAPVIPPPVDPSAEIPPVNFFHQSFFRKRADKILDLTLQKGPASSVAGLQTYNQKLANLLAPINLAANASSTFLEINTQYVDGTPVSASELMSLAGMILDPSFLLANFSPDFTGFVYKDRQGAWPGYIFKLATGKNWLFLKDEPAMAILEKSNKLESLFLSSPGNEDSMGFKDDSIASQSFRILHYRTPGAAFAYGWFNGGYLVFSSSRDGLEQALSRL